MSERFEQALAKLRAGRPERTDFPTRGQDPKGIRRFTTIPVRESPMPTRYRGVCERKPWQYKITAVIPCLDHAEETAICVALLRLQTVPPFVVLIDTGSKPEEARKLEAMRAPDLEVHQLRLNGCQSGSNPVAWALDLGFSRADTPYVFTTHQDCFLMRRDFLEFLLSEVNGYAVAGYRLTPRYWADWQKMFGHTATIFDMEWWDRLGLTWTMRRVRWDGPKPRDDPEHHNIGVWPDTESAVNTVLLKSGAPTKFVGTEENYVRNRDGNIDHCRSLVVSSVTGSNHYPRARQWADEAMQESRARIAGWRKERSVDRHHRPSGRVQSSPKTGVGTELKLLLRRFGIKARENCKCVRRSRTMDFNGVDWCEEHLEEVVDWLEEEAKNRSLPFIRIAGRILVRRAIKNARRKLENLERGS